MTNASLVAANFQMAALSALATWGLLLILVPLWVILSGKRERRPD